MSGRTHLLRRDDTALVVIDVQKRINAVMADQSHLPRLQVLMDSCSALEVPIVITEQYPKGLGHTVTSLEDRAGAPPVAKNTFSCAREPATRSAIEGLGRRQILVTGIETHVCVLQTALDLLQAGYEIHVPHDAVNSRRPADKEWALRRLEAAGVVVTTSESALFEMLERCGTDDFKTVAGLIKKVSVEPPPDRPAGMGS